MYVRIHWQFYRCSVQSVENREDETQKTALFPPVMVTTTSLTTELGRKTNFTAQLASLSVAGSDEGSLNVVIYESMNE